MTVQDLRQIDQLLTKRLRNFATKEDVRDITREELKGYATKEDLKNFATKDDLKNFATKDDIKSLASDLKETERRIIEEIGMTGKAITDAIGETGVFRSEIDAVKQRVSIVESKVL